MADKPKFKIKDFEFTLSDSELALCLAIRELTKQLKVNNNG